MRRKVDAIFHSIDVSYLNRGLLSGERRRTREKSARKFIIIQLEAIVMLRRENKQKNLVRGGGEAKLW
jgi:hypothetical protein